MKAERSDGGFVFNVEYDHVVPCVTMTWRGYCTSREFRASSECVLGELAQRRASRMLADVKEFVLIGMEDQKWLLENWIPRAINAGLRVVSMVTPVSYFNRVAVESVAHRLPPGALLLQYFDELDEARSWLSNGGFAIKR